MAIYRVFSDAAGESHIEDLKLEEHPELGALINVSEVRVQEFDGSRHRDFNLLPERRLIIHLSGEVEIGTSDGAKRVLRAGDIRLMEDVTGKGHSHSHNDLDQSGKKMSLPDGKLGGGLRPAERLIDHFPLAMPVGSGGVWECWHNNPSCSRVFRDLYCVDGATNSIQSISCFDWE